MESFSNINPASQQSRKPREIAKCEHDSIELEREMISEENADGLEELWKAIDEEGGNIYVDDNYGSSCVMKSLLD